MGENEPGMCVENVEGKCRGNAVIHVTSKCGFIQWWKKGGGQLILVHVEAFPLVDRQNVDKAPLHIVGSNLGRYTMGLAEVFCVI